MISIIKIDTQDKKQVKQFIRFHFDLYKECPQWVPPFIVDWETMMNCNKHPYYEHSDAEFFLALRDGKVVGRIAAMENKPFNQYHKTKDAEFYFFDSIDDQEVANALFDTVFEWAKARGLDHIVGPKGFGPLDGYGIQVEGFENRQMMNMMNYNYPYYSKLVEAIGFEKEVDFVSGYIPAHQFHLDPRIHEIAHRVLERGIFQVKRFKNKAELVSWADKIGTAYNDTFVQNWEYYPLSPKEVKHVVDTIIQVVNPKLIKIITADDKVVGFLLGFQDVSEAMQRGKGKLTPFTIIDLLFEMRKTKWISFNGMGILPEYHGRGGNALLYSEMEDTLHSFNFEHADLTQIAETTKLMRKDLENVGGKPYKNHRVFHKHI